MIDDSPSIFDDPLEYARMSLEAETTVPPEVPAMAPKETPPAEEPAPEPEREIRLPHMTSTEPFPLPEPVAWDDPLLPVSRATTEPDVPQELRAAPEMNEPDLTVQFPEFSEAPVSEIKPPNTERELPVGIKKPSVSQERAKSTKRPRTIEEDALAIQSREQLPESAFDEFVKQVDRGEAPFEIPFPEFHQEPDLETRVDTMNRDERLDTPFVPVNRSRPPIQESEFFSSEPVRVDGLVDQIGEQVNPILEEQRNQIANATREAIERESLFQNFGGL